MKKKIILKWNLYQTKVGKTIQSKSPSIHVEKVHFQIEVDDVSFIDKISLHASMNGGSLHEDEQGKKYLFYPIETKGQREMCLMYEHRCNLRRRIAYNNGDDYVPVSGRIFYQNITDAKQNYEFQIEENFRYTNFIVVDNIQKEDESIRQDLENLECEINENIEIYSDLIEEIFCHLSSIN